MAEKPFCVKLKNRGLLHLEGPDAHEFLQGLITNDMNVLDDQPMIYACLLNAQGKFLHDFFVYKGDGFYLIDCEGGARAQDLLRKLNIYRLRSDVQISIEDDHDVWAVFGDDFGLADPRHDDLGRRSLEKPALEERAFDEWDKRRISLTIPDGSRDLIVGKSTMDEARMDEINAIDYQKGCYVGQELTARMHYRGLGKKHLKTVQLDNIPEKAELRSSCGESGIALVKD